ncbi:MAG: hypothetical protein ACXVJB_12715 [Mucilaginibacter sp.]
MSFRRGTRRNLILNEGSVVRFTLLLFFTTILCSLASAQNSAAYQKALKYIVDDNRGKKMLVSDTIINIGFRDFWDRIDSLYGGNSDTLFHRLDSLDHARENQQFVLKEFNGVKFEGVEPVYDIFFSDFYHNMIIGEIMIQKSKNHPLNYNAQASFNEAMQYLFIFDKKHKLKMVLKQKMAYD